MGCGSEAKEQDREAKRVGRVLVVRQGAYEPTRVLGSGEECRGQRGGAGGAIVGRSCASKVAHIKVHVFTVVYYYTFTMYLLDVNLDLETFYRM